MDICFKNGCKNYCTCDHKKEFEQLKSKENMFLTISCNDYYPSQEYINRMIPYLTTGTCTSTKQVMFDRSLPIETKAIYAYLCSFSNAEAYPSKFKMASDLNISIKRLDKYLKLLIDNGYIQIQRNITTSGQFANNRYLLVI